MGDLDTAVLLCLDPSADPAVRARALRFCDDVRAAPDGPRFVMQNLARAAPMRPEVAFWCLQVLHDAVSSPARYQAADPAALRAAVLRYLSAAVYPAAEFVLPAPSAGMPPPAPVPSAAPGASGASAQLPPFLLNKLAQLVVALIGADYPHAWPDAFQNTVLALVSSDVARTDAAVSMFFRILRALDDDVTSVRAAQVTDQSRAISMRVKDGIRTDCVNKLVSWCAELVLVPRFASFALDIVARYVEWVDIGLFACDKFLNPIYTAVTSTDVSPARPAAAVALRAIVIKRMDARSKLTLLDALRVTSLLPAIPVSALSAHSEEADPELALQSGVIETAALVNAIAMVALDTLKSSTKQGRAADMDVVEAASRVAEVALPVALRFLGENADETTSAQTVQFVSTFVNTYARLRSRSDAGGSNGGTDEAGAGSAIAAILNVVEERSRFPADYDPRQDKDDTEEPPFAVLRHVLVKSVFRGIVRSFPALCLTFVQRLAGVASDTGDVALTELVLTMLIVLIEAAPDETPGLTQFRAMAMANPPSCMSSARPSNVVQQHQLESVSLTYFNLVARSYRTFFSTAEDSGLLAAVLPVFFDGRGLAHPTSPTIRSQAAYSLLKLTRPLRSLIAGSHIDAVLGAVQPLLLPVQPDSTTQAFQDQMLVFETVGYLLGTDHKRERSLSYLSELLKPLVVSMQEQDGVSAIPYISAAGVLSKGFGGDSKPLLLPIGKPSSGQNVEERTSPGSADHDNGNNGNSGKDVKLKRIAPLSQEMRAVWCACLEAVLKAASSSMRQVPSQSPSLPGTTMELRAKLLFFLHRMVDTIGAPVLRYLEQVLPEMLRSSSSPTDLRDVIILASQAVTKFGAAFEAVAVATYMPVVQRVHELSYNLDTNTLMAMSEEGREAVEVHRAYTYFLHALVTTDLIHVLTLPANIGILQWVVSSQLSSAVGASLDLRAAGSVMKMSFSILYHMVQNWVVVETEGAENGLAGSREKSTSPPGFTQFVIDELAPACIMSGVQGTLFRSGEYDNGSAVSVLTENVTLQRICSTRIGPAFGKAMRSKAMSSLPQDQVNEYLTALYTMSVTVSTLVPAFMSLLRRLRQQR